MTIFIFLFGPKQNKKFRFRNIMGEEIVICPNCKDYVVIKELNCGIFRHAILKTTGEQIDPHSSKHICEALVKNNLIYGCGKPFQILVLENGKWEIQLCDYI
jgi:hypothetical protein